MLSAYLIKQQKFQTTFRLLNHTSNIARITHSNAIRTQSMMNQLPGRDFSKVVSIDQQSTKWINHQQFDMNKRVQSYVLQSQKKNDEEDKAPPSGFEKFFKKKDKESSEKPEASTNKEQKKDDDDADLTELEEEEDSKDKKEEEKKDERNKIHQFLMDPDNNPKPESWLPILGALTAAYYLFFYKKPAEEIVFMDFYNEYMLKNQIKEITLVKDRRSEVFNVRAELLTHDGDRKYLVINTIDSFLQKLDLVQREMGKQPHEFIPVKVTNDGDNDLKANLMNLAIGAMFIAFFYQVYKGRNGNKPSTGKKSGKPTDKKEGGGFFGGGGGMNDMFGMSKSNAKQFGGEEGLKIKTRFRHVAGNEGAKAEIMEFVDFLKDPKKYQKLGARVPRGALLVGPPGTGKTLLAKAVAGESKVPFFTISGSDFVEMFVGVGASRVRDLFKKARAKAPSIIFIDEIDAVGKKRHGRGGGNDERDNTLNQLLVEMDGFSTDTSVIILAATNRADILDSALLRPGRFDRQVEVTLPSLEERAQIFKVHLKKILVNESFDKETYAKKLSALTPGFSGADIQNICNEAAIMAARADHDSVNIRDFELATERVIGGIEKSMPKNEQQRRTVAYHESGHAVAGWFSEHSAPLLKLTIIPRAKGSLGFAQYLPDEVSLYTKEQLCDMITVALGGRIAEEIFFDRITTGASDDIKKCTQIAQGIVCQYGMVPALGTINYANDSGYQKSYSARTGKMIDDEVKNIIDQQYKECREVILKHKDKLEALAERLLEKETIALPDIVEILGPRPFPLKSSLLEYLEELKDRIVEDEQIEAQKKIDEEEAAQKLEEQKEPKIEEEDAAVPDLESKGSEKSSKEDKDK